MTSENGVLVFDEEMTPVRTTAVFVPVTLEAIDDGRYVQELVDRISRPWAYPDRHHFPAIDLFPRWTRIEQAVKEVQRRARAAWYVLRHGDDHDPTYW